MNKQLISAVVAAIILAGGSGFYGGMAYGQNKSAGSAQLSGRMRFQGGAEDGTARAERAFIGRGQGGGFVAGEILAVDDKSITLKLPDGGSRIVILSDSTSVTKFADGSRSDLTVGASVMVTGSTNSDGSVTARSVQLRPSAPEQPRSAE